MAAEEAAKVPISEHPLHFRRFYTEYKDETLKYNNISNVVEKYDGKLICDPIGYKQHAGECWSDSIQQLILYTDGIKEKSQPFFINNTKSSFLAYVQSMKASNILPPDITETQINDIVSILMLLKKRFVHRYNSLKEYTKGDKGFECLLEDKNPLERYNAFMSFFEPSGKAQLKRTTSGFLGIASANIIRRFVNAPKSNNNIAGASFSASTRALLGLLQIIGVEFEYFSRHVISMFVKKILKHTNENNVNNAENVFGNENAASAALNEEAPALSGVASSGAASNELAPASGAALNAVAPAELNEETPHFVINNMDTSNFNATDITGTVYNFLSFALFPNKESKNSARVVNAWHLVKGSKRMSLQEWQSSELSKLSYTDLYDKSKHVATSKDGLTKIVFDRKLKHEGHGSCFYKCNTKLMYYDDNFGVFETPPGLNIDEINATLIDFEGNIQYINIELNTNTSEVVDLYLFHEGTMKSLEEKSVRDILCFKPYRYIMLFKLYTHLTVNNNHGGGKYNKQKKRATKKQRNKRTRTRKHRA